MAKLSNGSVVTVEYQLVRTTTSPDETASGVKSYVANVSAFEILKLGTKENLRSYLAEYNPKKRNKVHEAIRSTIERSPERFITRNSGFVVGCSDVEIDDHKKVMRLKHPSILNGAQSQGEIKRWIEDTYGADGPAKDEETPFFVRLEVIADPDERQVVETAIARNTATPVKSISQAGSRGHLDDLESSIKAVFPDRDIRKSETDVNVYDTRKILQYTRLLMPVEVSKNDSAAEQLRPYKNPEQCLTEFCQWFESREYDPESRMKYDFTVAMAPTAIAEYEYWESHDGWNGQRVWEETKKGGRACRRDASGKIVWVSPGLIFPIMGALREFVVQQRNRWVLSKPKLFKPADMITRAVQQFRSQNSDPMQMGRDAGVYDALRIYPSTIVDVMRSADN
ncbi:MAG: AIPR family protein [Phycisphaerales bacterium]|nr:AIPR family protein [Phycisphaerales bacterium]